MRHYLSSLASIVILSAVVGSARAAIESADVTGGRLKGEVTNGIASFKGVPFAAPPVGALRWRAPQPVVEWSGTRNANTLAPACAQPWYEWMKEMKVAINEDCLYLDLWTAAATRKERRPVMVYIHGGGLEEGGSWQILPLAAIPTRRACRFGRRLTRTRKAPWCSVTPLDRSNCRASRESRRGMRWVGAPAQTRPKNSFSRMSPKPS